MAHPAIARARAEGHSQARLELLSTIVVIVVLIVSYARSGTQVTLEVNGRSWQTRTHQTTVDGFLREAGLVLQSEDIVLPALARAIDADQTIRVQRASPVLIEANGQLSEHRTHSSTVGEVLLEAGVDVDRHDVITMNGISTTLATALPVQGWEPASWPLLNGLLPGRADRTPVPRIRLQHAVPLSINDGGTEITVYSVARTVGEELLNQGIVLYLGDQIQPMLGSLLSAGMHVEINRAKSAELRVDGETIRLRTQARDVAWLLSERDVRLQGKDYVVPDLATEVTPGMSVRVVRVVEDWVLEAEDIPYETVRRADRELELDQWRTDQNGSNGVKKRRVHLIYEDGIQTSREVAEEWIERQPTARILSYGAKVVVRELETPDGVIRYWRKIRVLATSYTAATSGKTREHPEYGITRLGWRARKGLIAVDPTVIKLRTNIYVPGYGFGTAADTGGMIKGRWIDLCYDEDNLVLWKRWLDVYLLEPVPAAKDINYQLPDTPRERR